jgi:GntR family transcriptional regulator / MocR family aminotransferase
LALRALFPALRLGYLVVAPELVERFAAARLIMDHHSAVIDQAILCDFLLEGHWPRHIRRMREIYTGRLAGLRESVQQSPPPGGTVGWWGESPIAARRCDVRHNPA